MPADTNVGPKARSGHHSPRDKKLVPIARTRPGEPQRGSGESDGALVGSSTGGLGA